jgi:hypothetical protein
MDTPGDGTGTICDIVNDADSNGILWVNSAGNHAMRHWIGQFVDNTGAPLMHEFNTVGEINALGKSFTAGETIAVYLTWEDNWVDATNDYDLYLFATTSTKHCPHVVWCRNKKFFFRR